LPQLRIRSLTVPAAVLALACSHPLAPGDVLVGTWSSADAILTAATTGATFTVPCIAVSLPPLRLDDSLTFRATGVVTQAGGLVTSRVGDPYALVGHVLGNRVVVPYRWSVPGPGADTLVPRGRGILVCNA